MSKFTPDTSALLERLVREKKIEGMQPRNVRGHPNYAESFKGIKSSTFSTKLRRFREKYSTGISKNGSPAKSELNLNKKCTVADVVPDNFENTGMSIDLEHTDGESDSDEDAPSGVEVLMPHKEFKPIYSVGDWNNPEDLENRRVSVAILMCSGIDKRNDFCLNVVNQGWVLEYSVVWPHAMVNMEALHKMWLLGAGGVPRIEKYHPMLKSFDPFLEKLRRPHDGKIETKARISLPFKCETRFTFHTLQWAGSSQRVFMSFSVRLRSRRASLKTSLSPLR
eukprot:IDg6567t1